MKSGLAYSVRFCFGCKIVSELINAYYQLFQSQYFLSLVFEDNIVAFQTYVFLPFFIETVSETAVFGH